MSTFNIVLQDLLRLCTWLLLLALVFVPLERLFSQRGGPVWRRQSLTDLGWYFVNGLLVQRWLLALPLIGLTLLAHRIVPSAWHEWVAQWPLALRLGAALVVGDIGAYWGHRIIHERPLLWRFHAVHHSAERIDWLVNTRAHPLDMALMRFSGMVPIYVIGLVPQGSGAAEPVVLIYMITGTVWSYFVHANVRWRFGFLEQLVATPFFHHWHHTNDSPELHDRNYAAIFPWIDRLFGTLYLPRDWPQRYGCDTPVAPTLLGQLTQPFGGVAAAVEGSSPSSPAAGGR